MKFPLLVLCAAVLTASCDSQPPSSFQLAQPADATLNAKARELLPRLTRACSGLDRYAIDLTPATVGESAMDGYQGGVDLTFQVVGQPQALPPPLNVRSAHNTCHISINPAGTRAYIGKSACRSICEGVWQENSAGLMGREISLE